MPVIKATESLPAQPPIILYYGEPGVCKTTLANTSANPLLIDFDRGAKRSKLRKDVLVVNRWEDVIAEESAGTFSNYSTIIIDTAKACLDDFLMEYVTRMDYNMAKNKLKAYGEIGDVFKLFVNRRRTELVSIVIIAHAKKDEDTKKHIPDVTGQSYALLLRIADQVGYVSMQNNKRTITWNPTDQTVGKNVAQFEPHAIPDINDPDFKDFNARIMQQVQDSITAYTAEQESALKLAEEYQAKINEVATIEAFNEIVQGMKELPEYLRAPLRTIVTAKAKEMKWAYNKEAGAYEAAKEGASQPAQGGQAEAGNTTPAPANQEPEPSPTTSPRREEIITAFNTCRDAAGFAEVYMTHIDTIEADEVLKGMFDTAMAQIRESKEHHLDPKDPAPVVPVPAQEAPLPDSYFAQAYPTLAQLSEALEKTQTLQQLVLLHDFNEGLVNSGTRIQNKFSKRRDFLTANTPADAVA